MGVKFFTLGCSGCKCEGPLIAVDRNGQESFEVFRTRIAAQVKASEVASITGKHPNVIEVELNKI